MRFSISWSRSRRGCTPTGEASTVAPRATSARRVGAAATVGAAHCRREGAGVGVCLRPGPASGRGGVGFGRLPTEPGDRPKSRERPRHRTRLARPGSRRATDPAAGRSCRFRRRRLSARQRWMLGLEPATRFPNDARDEREPARERPLRAAPSGVSEGRPRPSRRSRSPASD